MRRAVAIAVALAASGCYDVEALSRSTTTTPDGGAADGATDAAAASSWRALTSPTTAALRGVFGGDGGAVFAVGASSTIVRLDATGAAALETAPPGYELRAVWSGGGVSLAVGDSGTVLSRATSGWSGASLVDATFYAVTALDAAQPLVAGSGGTLMQQASGGTWQGVNSGVAVQLRGAFARPGGDTFVVGDGGTILRGSGGSWNVVQSGVTADLYAVWATASDAWIVGTGGVVLHASAGDAFAPEPSGTAADLYGVFGAGDVVWAVGAGGTVVAHRGGAWSVERTGGAHLRAVWAGANGAWAVGDRGTILARTP